MIGCDFCVLIREAEQLRRTVLVLAERDPCADGLLPTDIRGKERVGRRSVISWHPAV